jgi:threonine/homoserine/homoserine lactone efflux protein
MKQRRHTYTTYSIGYAIVWMVTLLATARRTQYPDAHTLRLVCGGWWLGWLSATIARSVDPGPKSWSNRA